MKTSLLALLAIFSLSNNAYYEDHPRVQELADSGAVILEAESEDCSRGKYSTRLGTQTGFSALCVEEVKLPVPVSYEVILMKEYELENESDYDSRITELNVFKGSFSTHMSIEEARNLIKSFSVSISDSADIHFYSEVIDEESFNQFENLFIGYDMIEAPMTVSFLRKLLKGENALRFSFTDGVELYPGGGFNVTHQFILVKGKLVYFKNSWWDA